MIDRNTNIRGALRQRQRGFIINPYRFGSAGGGSDPYFSDVSALLPMTGADGSTTFADVIGNTWTPTGGAQIDTAIKPFGSGSMLVNGNGYIQTASSSRFGFGSGLYTMECMIYGTSPSSAVGNVFDTRTPGGNVGIALFFGGGAYSQPTNTVGVSSNSAVLANAGINVVLQNTWYHFALVRDTGNILRVYVNGAQVISVADSRTYASSSTCYIGADAFGTVAQRFYGSITQARITKGVCRYPSGTSFTPPSAPFPTS